MKYLLLCVVVSLFSMSVLAEEFAPLCEDKRCEYVSGKFSIQKEKDGEWLQIHFANDEKRKDMRHGPYRKIEGLGFFVVTRNDGKQNMMDISGKTLMTEWADEVTSMQPNGLFSSRLCKKWRLHNVRGCIILAGQTGPAVVYATKIDLEEAMYYGTKPYYITHMGWCLLEIHSLGLYGPVMEVKHVGVDDCSRGQWGRKSCGLKKVKEPMCAKAESVSTRQSMVYDFSDERDGDFFVYTLNPQ